LTAPKSLLNYQNKHTEKELKKKGGKENTKKGRKRKHAERNSRETDEGFKVAIKKMKISM
jgi:hypothetical protein